MNHIKAGLVDISELEITIRDLKQDRDHWRQAYCNSENETIRFQKEYKKIYKELMELKKLTKIE